MKKYLLAFVLFVFSLLNSFAAPPADFPYFYMLSGVSQHVRHNKVWDSGTLSYDYVWASMETFAQKETQLTWEIREYNQSTKVTTSSTYVFTRVYGYRGIPIDWWVCWSGYTQTSTTWRPEQNMPFAPPAQWFYSNGDHPYYERTSIPFNSGAHVSFENVAYRITSTESSTMKVVNAGSGKVRHRGWWGPGNGMPWTYSEYDICQGESFLISPRISYPNQPPLPWVGFIDQALDTGFSPCP